MSDQDRHEGGSPHRSRAIEDVEGFLPMFQRAFTHGDKAARGWLEQRMEGMLLHWLQAHPAYATVHRLASDDHYIAQAFAQLWQLMDRQPQTCDSLAIAFKYLHVSLNSVLLDTARLRTRKQLLQSHYEDARTCWEQMQALLTTEKEQRIAYLLFHCGLNVDDILRLCPREFSDRGEVVRLRAQVLKQVQSLLVPTQ